MMLLVTSVLSAAVVGAIGYQSGRSSLRESVFDRLTEIRQSQSRQLREGIGDLKNSLVIYSRGATSIEAIGAFTAGFDQLNAATISPAQQQSLVDYYTQRFAPQKAAIGEEVDVDAVLPRTNASRYLQAYYTAPFSDWDKSIQFDNAGDGSAWSAASARYNDFFREIVQRFEFEDALLFDTRGNVVYTAYKGADLGTNVFTGPFKGGLLASAYKEALESNTVDYVGITDFGEYEPADEPTAWFLSPVGPQGSVEGVLALQFPISKINRLMTMDRRWQESGMGETGETFIVGPDDLMRSDSRMFIEDPEAYKRRRRRGDRTRHRCRSDPAGRHDLDPTGADGGHQARAAGPSGHADRRGLSRSRDAAGVRPGRHRGPAVERDRQDQHVGGVRAGIRVHPHAGAVDGRDHLRRLSCGDVAPRGCSSDRSGDSKPAPRRSVPGTTTSACPSTHATSSATSPSLSTR
jgi:hypothetical protein